MKRALGLMLLAVVVVYALLVSASMGLFGGGRAPEDAAALARRWAQVEARAAWPAPPEPGMRIYEKQIKLVQAIVDACPEDWEPGAPVPPSLAADLDRFAAWLAADGEIHVGPRLVEWLTHGEIPGPLPLLLTAVRLVLDAPHGQDPAVVQGVIDLAWALGTQAKAWDATGADVLVDWVLDLIAQGAVVDPGGIEPFRLTEEERVMLLAREAVYLDRAWAVVCERDGPHRLLNVPVAWWPTTPAQLRLVRDAARAGFARVVLDGPADPERYRHDDWEVQVGLALLLPHAIEAFFVNQISVPLSMLEDH